MFRGFLKISYFAFQHIWLKTTKTNVSPFSGMGLLCGSSAGVTWGHICDFSHLVNYQELDGPRRLHSYVWWLGLSDVWPLSPHGLTVPRTQVQKLQGLLMPFSEAVQNHFHCILLVTAYHKAKPKSRAGKRDFSWGAAKNLRPILIHQIV